MKFLYPLVFCAALVVSSCGRKSTIPDEVSNPASGAGQGTGKQAKISFKDTVYDFGRVVQGDQVQHTFEFTNTGKAPLLVLNASPSCGCTVPDWPKDPIEPGKTGEIDVQFNTAGKSGEQNKTVTVLTNSNPAAVELVIKGLVLLPEKR